jgi:hypothetical protein
MTKPIRTPSTYADVEKVRPHLVVEIIHGVLETPRPRSFVIASAAKQSSPMVPRVLKHRTGLLRRCAPRNDGVVAAAPKLINSPPSSIPTES